MKKPIEAQAPAHPGPAEGWNPYDEYDCRENEPEQTQAYIDAVWPAGVREAIQKRQAELKASAVAAIPQDKDHRKRV